MYGCEIMFITRLLKCPTARSLLLVMISSYAMSFSSRTWFVHYYLLLLSVTERNPLYTTHCMPCHRILYKILNNIHRRYTLDPNVCCREI